MAELGDNAARFKDIRVLILEDNPTDAEFLEYDLKGNGVIFNSELVFQVVTSLSSFWTKTSILFDIPERSSATAAVSPALAELF